MGSAVSSDIPGNRVEAFANDMKVGPVSKGCLLTLAANTPWAESAQVKSLENSQLSLPASQH